eukprot:scaffold130164_cov25-Cyclotella_meneghiniana.AAC.1
MAVYRWIAAADTMVFAVLCVVVALVAGVGVIWFENWGQGFRVREQGFEECVVGWDLVARVWIFWGVNSVVWQWVVA